MDRLTTSRWPVSLFAATLILEGAANPAAAQVVTEFRVPASGRPLRIAPGPGGMWFTEQGSNRIGLITSEGDFSEFAVNRQAWEIVAGPDGNLWFTSDKFLSRMTPTGDVTDFAVSGLSRGITVGPDGNIWFTEMPPGSTSFGDGIGRATTSGQITEFTDSGRASCWGDITSGPDGNLWCTDWSELGDDSVVRITPSGVATRFLIPGGLNASVGDVGPTSIVVGSDGKMWFLERRLPQVGRMTTSGEFSTFAVSAQGIAAGSDGNLWLTQDNGIGRLTTGGDYTEFGIPTANAGAYGIGAGSDGNIWFTEPGAMQIGRISGVSRTLEPIYPPDRHPRELATR